MRVRGHGERVAYDRTPKCHDIAPTSEFDHAAPPFPDLDYWGRRHMALMRNDIITPSSLPAATKRASTCQSS
jgi:hypothetical protein